MSTFLTASLRKHLFGLFWFSQVIFFSVNYTLPLSPCGYVLLYGSIYCWQNALWRENWEIAHKCYWALPVGFCLFGFFTWVFFSSESQAIMHYFFRKCPAPFTPTAWGNCATEGTRQNLKHAKACGSDTVFLRQVWVKFILCTTSSGFISCQAQTCRVSHVLLAGSQKQAESKSILQPHLLASSGQSCLGWSRGKQSCWNSQYTERRCDFLREAAKPFQF